ncbi:MAG: permease-like cell division protein FtsX, partial [Gammaproteobacteria bacterium]|nr:permease-like cell division protein FtsX [Gammaproteobacteria bacterium]
MIVRYLQLHLQTLGSALGRIGNTWVGAMLNVLVVAIALALPAALQVLIANAGQLSASFDSATEFSVYLDLEVDDDDARTLNARIEDRDDVAGTRFISRVEALAEFKSRSGFGDALDALNENPLPHTIVVRPASDDVAAIERLGAELGAVDGVASVQLDSEWIARLNGMLALIGRIVDIVTVLLAAAVVLVIGNTIRLEINNRSTEIEVLKLVGATDGFIRRPFLYTGFCLGLIGALTAAL